MVATAMIVTAMIVTAMIVTDMLVTAMIVSGMTVIAAINVATLLKFQFFPRASERRVLLIAGVCQTFSHFHIFT